MCEESDPEITELDIESKTWNKLEKNMEVMGFQEGAAKGRDLSLQHGFNLGYSDGFKIGEHLGMMQGRLSFQKKLLDSDALEVIKGNLEILTYDICVLCPKENMKSVLDENETENFEKIILKQQSQNDYTIKKLKDLNFEKNLQDR